MIIRFFDKISIAQMAPNSHNSMNDAIEALASLTSANQCFTISGKHAFLEACSLIDSAIEKRKFRLLASFQTENNELIHYCEIEHEILRFTEIVGLYKSNEIPNYCQITSSDVSLARIALFSYSLEIQKNSFEFFLFHAQIMEASLSLNGINKMSTLVSFFLPNASCFVTWYPKRAELRCDYISWSLERKDSFQINMTDKNTICFKNEILNVKLSFRRAKKGRIAADGVCSGNIKPGFIWINQKRYCYWSNQSKFYLSGYGSDASFGPGASFNAISLGRYFLLYGYVRNSTILAHDVALHDSNTSLAKLHKVSKYYFAFIPAAKLLTSENMHTALVFTSDDQNIRIGMRQKDPDQLFVFTQQKVGDSEVFLRMGAGGNLMCTILPYAPEHSTLSRLKQRLAYLLSAVTKPIRRKPVNLFFEKKSSKADESAIRVFENVMKRGITSSDNFFILDKKSPAYKKLKKRYPSRLIRKYSLSHYFRVMQASYFISSELSNHVINDRVFINKYRKKISSTPLIFLQHGIMFAKPIDNPQAADFHKKNLQVNLKKTVISSELEAQEFYKVGYKQDDLLLTGLATFDCAYLDPKANKIAYMPTYRYWEEHLVYSGQVKETTYYQDIVEVIEVFRKANLLERLLVVPHNKFSNYLKDAFPDFPGLVSDNPSEALRRSVVFITDYSSAIYDAIIRGAYPIFYWKAKDYLIENYRAIPPVNETNAPGPIAYSEEELIQLVNRSIRNKYSLEKEYLTKYRAINQFYDRKNTDRIVSYLISNNVI